MDGVLIVDKPVGKTSFDIIREVRKEYLIKKVGHIGTLDPMASGVLPVLIGKATKLSDYLMEHDKEYIATMQLGVQTSTGDSEGIIIKEQEIPQDTFDAQTLSKVFSSFLGESFQIPPMYSAIKINGKKLYELAREGKTVERHPRKINIYEIEMLKINQSKNQITFRVVCSKGTYIRTLCEDIATKLGTCAYMLSLERTRVGDFNITDAGKFIDISQLFSGIPTIEVLNISQLQNGQKIPLPSSLQSYQGLVKLTYQGNYIGLGKSISSHYQRFILMFDSF